MAGPNGSGKTTLFERVIGPATHLPFVNADVIAADAWPDDPAGHAYEASAAAAERRAALLDQRRSFATETVFSHPSKVDLVDVAVAAGYLVILHVVVIPEALAVARVASRVAVGGHAVPEDKISERYHRLWPLVVEAIGQAASATVYDNSRAASPLRVVATFEAGRIAGTPAWPAWTPAPLVALAPAGCGEVPGRPR